MLKRFLRATQAIGFKKQRGPRILRVISRVGRPCHQLYHLIEPSFEVSIWARSLDAP
jgi:hypothetical protein